MREQEEEVIAVKRDCVGQTWRHGRLVGTTANPKALVLKRPLLPLDTRRVTKPTHVPHYHIIDMLCYNTAGCIWVCFFFLTWIMLSSPIGLDIL